MRSIFFKNKKLEGGGTPSDLWPTTTFREGLYLQQEGKLVESAAKLECALEEALGLYGSFHQSTCSSYSHLGEVCAEMGRYAEAEKHWKACEAGRAKTLGPLHDHTLDSASRVFEMLWIQNKYEDAKRKGKKVVAALTKVKGPEHLKTLSQISLLGGVYMYLARYEKALRLHRVALAGYEKTLGSESVATIHAQYKLASALGEMQNFPEALEIYKRNQEVCERALGVESTHYLRAALQVGQYHDLLGNDAEAEATLKSILPMSGADPDHEHWKGITSKAAQTLIRLYRRLGRRADADNVAKWMRGEAETFAGADSSKGKAHSSSSQSATNGETLLNDSPALPSILDEEAFHWELKIVNAKGEQMRAVALLDTQCQSGNWISQRLVERLGKESSISQDHNLPSLADASGCSVTACGVVELEWKQTPRGNRFHQCGFFVFPPSSNHFDVIFGVEYIVKENLLRVNEDAIVPLVAHKKLSKNDKAAIAISEEKQRQEKAALEAKRAAVVQAEASQQSQNQQASS